MGEGAEVELQSRAGRVAYRRRHWNMMKSDVDQDERYASDWNKQAPERTIMHSQGTD